MKTKLVALVALLLCCALLAGCMSTEGLKKVPQGVRPETMDMAALEPQFPSDSSIKNQMMSLATEVKTSESIDAQREKYDEFLHNAYIYIVGPYNFTTYLAADGRSITAYYESMINHMNTFLSEWDVSAWSAIGDSAWGAQLKSEYGRLKCTPDSIRNAYPTANESTSGLLKTMYEARNALNEALEGDWEQADAEGLLDDVFTSREAVADSMQYASYLDFVVEKRDLLPYDLDSLLRLAQLVQEHLVPAVQSAEGFGAPQLTAEQWQAALPALAERFPEYSEDLLYALQGGAYVVEEGQQSKHFAYQLYQYDVSAGKAVLSGQEGDALEVLRGLGLEARNMALPESEWSMSALGAYDCVQEDAFAGRALAELDAVYGADADAARQGLVNEMARQVCRAAMELELLAQLYDDPVMAQGEREQLARELAAAYGFEGLELADIVRESDDVLMGGLDCAGRMLGGLYGLTLYELSMRDAQAADAALDAALAVYNAGNPISAGYSAGMDNPYSAQGVQNVAALVK